jgi:predicted DNA-binding protein
VKTAISVPDKTHERVERTARRHGMNRSQFYAAAAERYADDLESADLIAAIDAALDTAGTDGSARFAVNASQRVLAPDDEEW